MRSTMVIVFGLSIIFADIAVFSEATAFLGSRPQDNVFALSSDSEHTLLAELEGALGSGHKHATEKRLKRLEQMLSPMFAAMVKNENGKLGPAAAGYMLHRIFVQRHGWFIRALEPASGAFAAWNTSTPTSVLEERLPEHVVELFERRQGQHGLGLRELAVLASTLEHVVHTEALQRLTVAYLGASFSRDDALSDTEAAEVLDVYMSIYILGYAHGDLDTLTADKVRRLHSNIGKAYPTWPETQQFLREVHQSVAPKRDYLYFNDIEQVVEEVSERYGRFQNLECRQLRDWLVEAEDTSVGGAGRVRLADFYRKALHEGKWHFSESEAYLRQLGALDESDPSNPRVIITNYIYAPSNCIVSSGYYSVCCIDECEDILGKLEQQIAAPEASVDQIIKHVSTIASASVSSNRTIAPWLRDRLVEVAAHHGGLIPLHGRLFAQWLHYAYPHECQFPHVSGTADPKRPEDWEPEEGSLSASKEVMKKVIAEAPLVKSRTHGTPTHGSQESSMWSLHEELVVRRAATHQPSPGQFGVGLRGLAMMGAVLSVSIAMVRSFQCAVPALSSRQKAQTEKYFV